MFIAKDHQDTFDKLREVGQTFEKIWRLHCLSYTEVCNCTTCLINLDGSLPNNANLFNIYTFENVLPLMYLLAVQCVCQTLSEINPPVMSKRAQKLVEALSGMFCPIHRSGQHNALAN